MTAAKLVDLGVSDEWVELFRDEMSNETATIVLLVEDADSDALSAKAERFQRAKLAYTSFDAVPLRGISEALGSEIRSTTQRATPRRSSHCTPRTGPGGDPDLSDALKLGVHV